ncbi:hypothetical protein NSQ95_09830 [Psychrobacillus sp. FSL W7-1457]|uniref:hypothetical protein n=1 Tax=Psychrobacillus sp. FSL W7-1457 TaxID=2954547 RepID=UPI00315B0535
MQVIPVIISVFALGISWFNSIRDSKKYKNIMLRLLILADGLSNDYDKLMFEYRMLHLIPRQKNEQHEDSFKIKKSLLQLKINQMYELLLINQKIVDEDLKKIFSCLNGIDQNLFELANSRIDNFMI